MIMVDTSVWVDYLNGHATPQTDYLDRALGHELVATGDLILTEVLQGLRSEAEFKRVLNLFATFPRFDMAGYDNAVQSARNFRALRARGYTVRRTIDMLIGTCCIAHDLQLLHDDRDFDAMERGLGLRVIPL